MSSSHSTYPTSDSEAFWGAGALLMGLLVAVLGFVSLMMWIDARNARDDAHRIAAATSTNGMAGMPGMTGSTAAAGVLTSYAGAAPANADALAAAHALAVFAYRIAIAVASMAVPLGGVDAIVFTGGVGERSEAVRAAVCARLGFLGVGTGSVAIHVVEAREDVVAAREARRVLRNYI